jgi:transposase
MLSELRFELWIGDAAEIRAKRVRKQKTDRQDAQLILKLMLKDDFPQIWARYRAGGAKALQHGNCGRVSNRAYTAKYRGAVLTRVQARYQDFGPTLASEHLGSDDGLEVHAETLRRWLKEAGLWQRQRRRKPYRQRREAKAHFGELVQLDGSFHEWLEERGPRGCLMHMVDDATTKALGWFSAEETIWAAAGVLRRWIERYTACRKPCTPTGRTCTCGRRMRGSGCAENRR